jgi:hypothetical protein
MSAPEGFQVQQADILADAVTSLNELARKFSGLISQFEQDVTPLLAKYAT